MMKQALNWEGYHRCRARKKPFINLETQHARKVYEMIHLHKPVEFWESDMYSDECSFNASARGTTWSLDFEMNASTTIASITISKAVGLRGWSRVLSVLTGSPC
jgi:hypothetical protein